MIKIVLKSILHNIGVVAVGFIFALVGLFIDTVLKIHTFQFLFTLSAGWLLVSTGFLLRVWATFHFYKHQMKVVSLSPQNTLLTSGPYRYSRNPLYLGGNIFIFFGTSLILGSPSALVLSVLNIFIVDRMIKREEKQLEQKFGKEWLRYKKRVRRWI